MDPNPPPARTYLGQVYVRATLNLLNQTPGAEKRVYRRLIAGILRFIFPETEGYEVIPTARDSPNSSDFSIFQMTCRPGGSLQQNDFMLIESRSHDESWDSTEQQLQTHLAKNRNESKDCYGMVQIGLVVQFYKYEEGIYSKIGGKMHLVTDVNQVMERGQYVKDNILMFA